MTYPLGGHGVVQEINPDETLMGWWKLDETSGTVIDTTLNNNDGTVIGTTQDEYGVYKNGKGYSLDGVNDYIIMPDDSTLQITGDLTITVWVRMSAIGAAGSFLFKGTGTNAGPYRFQVTNVGELRFGRGNGTSQSAVSGTDTISGSTWSHVAVTMSGTTVTFYINGVADSGGTKTISTTTADSGNSLLMGKRDADDQFLNGRLDEVRIFNEAKDATFILNDYRSADGIDNYHNMILWCKLDRSGGTPLDFSSNGYNSNDRSNLTRPVDGQINTAVSFNGTNSWIRWNPAATDIAAIGTGNFTLACWIKTTSTNANNPIFSVDVTDPSFQVDGSRTGNDGRLNFKTAANNYSSDITDLCDGNFHHVAFVRTGTGTDEFLFYADGVAAGTETATHNINTATNVSMGKDDDGNFFDGTLDDFRFYNVALTSTEVSILAGMSA